MSYTRARRFGAVLLAAAFAVGACSSGDESSVEAVPGASDALIDDVDGNDTTGDAATSDPADPGAPATDPVDGTADPAPTGDPGTGSGTDPTAPPAAAETTTTTAAPSGTAPPAAVATPIAPKAGTYTYERTTKNDEGTETANTDALVKRLSGDDTNAKLELTQDSSQGRITTMASAGANGILAERSIIQSPLGEVDCDWNPDWQFVGGYTPGNTWNVDTTCSDDVNGVKITVTIKGTGKIVGTESITVKGKTVTAWKVTSDLSNKVVVSSPTISGTQTTKTTQTSWIDPANGMAIRTVETENSSGDFGAGTSTSTSDLIAYKA